MSEWKKYRLGEIAEIIMGQSPMGETCNENGDGIPLLNGPTEFGSHYPTPVQYTTDAKKLSKINDILFCVRGSTTGKMNWSDRQYAIGRGIAAIRHKNGNQYRYFLRGVIDNNIKNILGIATGSTFPNISGEQLREFEISAPKDLSTQKEIASILSSLDDKIELNLQMNQTLEAMAQAIFKEWFVDFNYPTSEPLIHDDLYDVPDLKTKKSKQSFYQKNPGSDNLVDGLPKGWRIGTLGEIVEVKGGTTPSTVIEEYWNGEFYWSTPKDLSNIQSPVLLDTERKITEAGIKQISSGILPAGTLLLSSRAPIGYLAISQVPISINQGYIAIQGKLVSNLFMLFWLKQNLNAVKGRANGSTFQEISKSNFKEIEIVIPEKEALQLFDKTVNPIFERIVANEYEIKSLTQIRDSLLPKLMTGKIRLNCDFYD